MWEILGIEPTKELKAIKKAYAALAKKYNPEEHPNEFRRLYTAYKDACKYAVGNFPAERRSFAPLSAEENNGGSYDFDKLTIHDTMYDDAGSPNAPAEENSIESFDFEKITIYDTLYDAAEYSAVECEKILLAVMRKFISSDDTKNDAVLWKEFFRSRAFEKLIFNTDFRRRSSDLISSEIFPFDTAKEIAAGFSYGTSLEHINYYPVHECRVKIAAEPLRYNAVPMNPILTSDGENDIVREIDISEILKICAAVFAGAFIIGLIICYAAN